MNRGDYLDYLLEESKKELRYSSEWEFDYRLVVFTCFASYEYTSSAITFAVKFISDHPEVLEE